MSIPAAPRSVPLAPWVSTASRAGWFGAVVVGCGGVPVSGGGGPGQPPVGWASTRQPAWPLEAVVVPAQRVQVRGAGLTPSAHAHGVVQFGVGGAAAAQREPAVQVAGADVVGQPGGWLVGAAPVVQHGARQRVGDQPPPHPVGGDLPGRPGGAGRARPARRARRRRRSGWSARSRPGSAACRGWSGARTRGALSVARAARSSGRSGRRRSGVAGSGSRRAGCLVGVGVGCHGGLRSGRGRGARGSSSGLWSTVRVGTRRPVSSSATRSARRASVVRGSSRPSPRARRVSHS